MKSLMTISALLQHLKSMDFTGLVLSNISNIDLDKKVLTFMDIDEGSLSKSRKLIKCIQSELKSSNLDIRSGEEADYEVIASL